MDTIYFAADMIAFVEQVKKWMKPKGIFFVEYQEGDVIPKTDNMYSTLLAKALDDNRMQFDATDITEETYELLKTKRAAAIKHEKEFEAEGNREWFSMLMGQTECVTEPCAQFREKMSLGELKMR